jgi:exosortase
MNQTSDKWNLPWTPRQLVLAGVLLLGAVAAMGSCWLYWAETCYRIAEHSHVFLAVPFLLAIVYVNRAKLATVSPRPSWAGPLILAGGWLMSWYGYTDRHQSMFHFGAVLVALGAVVSVLGHSIVLRFWQAFLLLGFMVPMPSRLRLQIALPLQTAMASSVERILNFFGEHVIRQHNSLTINGRQVEIVEACNGLRLVFTLILVSWLFAFVTPLKHWVRWMIIILSPVTALVCNVIRLIPTLLLHGHASKETADWWHDALGWAMIPIAFFFLMFVISFIEACGVEVREGGPGDRDGNAGDGGNVGADKGQAEAATERAPELATV